MQGLAESAALYPFAYDLARGALMLVPMAQDDYRAASFLDERLTKRGAWTPVGGVAQAMSGARDVRPLHFIFHAGHVGSTLLSRLLDETGVVLSLREPLTLRQMAEAYDHGGADRDERLELMLRLWERGFTGTEAVVLKATSATQRLAPRLLRHRAQARAILLNVSAESYLATMLAAENSAQDLNAYGAERHHRLGQLLNAPAPRPSSLGQLAAMSWLVERLTQDRIQQAVGPRALAVDFDRMLDSLGDTLERIARHLNIAADIAAILESRTLSRYSKAPEHAYGPDLRQRRLDEARRLYGSEIAAALNWLNVLGRGHGMVAAVL
jgi:hypothetical protein